MVSKKMDFLTFSVVRVFTTFVLCCYLSTAAPVITTETEAIMYLQKYGYMKGKTNSSPSSVMDEAAFSQAIKDFQKFTGLAESGVLDKPTLKMMSMPRCGGPDEVGHTRSSRRRKRYALLGEKWTHQNLTYRISKYPTSIKDKAKVDEEIAKAFKVWSDVSSLNFEVSDMWIPEPEDIEIRFEKGEHGDRKFDGPGGKAAHAFYPLSGGDVHFDDEEKWTIGEFSGVNLFQTAAHEFGHSLGLDHSDVKAAVMFPIYQGYKPNFTLDKDDILGIQKLYGPPTNKRAVAEPESKPGSNPDASGAPDLCQNSSIDAATVTEDGRTYVFKGDYYWEIGETGIIDGYPRRISDDWRGLPGNLDAALTSTSGKTYFFKKHQYWRFHNKRWDRGYPHNISVGFRGIPNDIDTAFAWNGKIYFLKGDLYWKYNGSRVPPVDSIFYPQPVSNWKGLPNNIDAAFQWTNQDTYLFKGSNYYRINYNSPFVDHADPPYPRSTSVWWFGCEKAPDICRDSSIDAATATESGKVNRTFYVFKGNYYWEIGNVGRSDGYPRKISSDWSGLPGDLDAALTRTDGKTFFFKKNLFWRFHNKKMDNGYPQNISTGFPGIPNDIDSAFVWNLNKKIYFFKGDNYWRFDGNSEPSVSSRYPQPISNWQGLPNNIEAALWWGSNVHFFKGNQYYKLNEITPSVAVVDPPDPSYPRSTYFWILDCEDWKELVF